MWGDGDQQLPGVVAGRSHDALLGSDVGGGIRDFFDEQFDFGVQSKMMCKTKGDEKMKKSWVLGVLLSGLALYGLKVWADGSFVSAPGPVVAATGQNYYYPAASAPAAGALLVQDGSLTFRYSNAVVGTTTTLTVLQFPTLPSLTLAQLNALTPSTTGQMAYCSNCVNTTIVISSGIGANAWVNASSPTVSAIH